MGILKREVRAKAARMVREQAREEDRKQELAELKENRKKLLERGKVKSDKKEEPDKKAKQNTTKEAVTAKDAISRFFTNVILVSTPRLITLWTAWKKNSNEQMNVRWRFIAYHTWWITAAILLLIVGNIIFGNGGGYPVKVLVKPDEDDPPKRGKPKFLWGPIKSMAMLIYCVDVYICFVLASWANEGDASEKLARKEQRRVSR